MYVVTFEWLGVVAEVRYSSAARSVGSEQRRISTRSPRALTASVVMAFCVERMRFISVQ